MRAAFVALLVVHGAIHIAGFAKAFGLAEAAPLQPISRPLGAVWLLSGLAFFVSAALFVLAPRHWWVAAVPALVLSQVAIATSWGDARFGTLANVVVLVPLAVSLLDLRSTSFPSIYEQDVARGLAHAAPVAPDAPVTEADVARLPPLVQTYVRRTGAVGRPRVRHVRTRWRAQMRMAPGAPWLRARATQHNFFDPPRARVFLMEASRYGVPFVALHRYAGAAATMQVRVASLFDIVNARGPEMNQAETVTMFNDMCVIAPASLVDASVTWQEIDGHSVRGTFTNAGHTVAAVLSFDAHGDLVNFVSEDRYLSADGKTYEKLPWSTPLRAYGDFDGRRVASRGEAVWKQPGGDYVYGRFELEEAEYNPRLTRGGPAMIPSLIDTFMPAFSIRQLDRVAVAASPGHAYAPGREAVVGAVGKFWQPAIEYASVTPADFTAFDRRGFGKLAWCIRVDPREGGGSWVGFELRVGATDAASLARFERYWWIIGRFSHAIRRSFLGRLVEELGPAVADERRTLEGDDFLMARFQRTHGVTNLRRRAETMA